jgi:prevent-host-death family protein
MKFFTASEARANLYKLIDEVAQLHEPVYVKGKRNKIVLLSQEDYESMQETLHLLSIPGLKESIQEGLKEDVSNCAEKIDWNV